jgi:predicted transcriptional regulator
MVRYIPLKEMNLSTKRYYSRIAGLVDVGLIKRNNGKYFLTLMGKVVYQSQMLIGKTLSYYWKLKAIESVERSSNVEIPKEGLTQLINALIDNYLIKDILIKEPMSYTFEDHQLHQHQQLIETKLIAS